MSTRRPDFEKQFLERIARVRSDSDAIMRESVQRLIAFAQTPIGAGGNMPVDVGFLRASLVVRPGRSPMVAQDKPKSGGPVSYDAGPSSLAILAWDMTGPLRAIWTARYARHVHYGARGRPGRPWVTLARQRWPQIVGEVIADAKGRRG
ncbi:MAG: hypothetical protein K2X07_02800 [Caulobacteraceae bacterium]|nr:hypothetical protein [Caulobacteraceae bacterium]